MSQLRTIAVTIFYLSLLSNCGQTGPLYLPESSTSEAAGAPQRADQGHQLEKNNDN
ncbi:MAG: lipoprotein [Proteobacteria bacterium]|nr:lipoprotein [Pseudomonadota bacterium]MDA1011288.1 lipoprotein [Pseudomonadota bacterium]